MSDCTSGHDDSLVIDFAELPVFGRTESPNPRRVDLGGVPSRMDLILKHDYGT